MVMVGVFNGCTTFCLVDFQFVGCNAYYYGCNSAQGYVHNVIYSYNHAHACSCVACCVVAVLCTAVFFFQEHMNYY